jgi:hypothetical protein
MGFSVVFQSSIFPSEGTIAPWFLAGEGPRCTLLTPMLNPNMPSEVASSIVSFEDRIAILPRAL